MEKPRILFVTRHHLLTTPGGAEEQGWLLSTEMARRGWDVHYASEMKQLIEPAVREGVTHHALPVMPSIYSCNRDALREVLNRVKPDVVMNIMYNLYTRDSMVDAPKGAFRVWFAAAEGDGQILRKLILFRRSAGTVRFLRRLPKLLRFVWTARQGARAADLVIAQRQEQFDALKRAGYHCVLIRNTQLSVPDADVQSHTGTATVLWAASIKDWKEPRKFIELARRCGDLDAQFVMIGHVQEEKYHAILISAVAELANFRYDGPIPLARVGEYFKKAHLFISTSISEGYPTTFIQAWQRGVPVVSLHNVNPEKLLTEKGFGVLAASLDEMEKAVRELLADPDRRRDIGGKARAFAQEECELTHTVDKLEKILSERGVRLPAR
jgi:glycosyltransferase involved in cell wall biosynthesis